MSRGWLTAFVLLGQNSVDMEGLYRERIIDHARHPRNRGVLGSATHQAREANPRCGDICLFQLRADEATVVAAMFDGHGCALATAAASLLTEHAVGLPLAELQKLSGEEFLEKLGVAVTSGRIDCALLPWRSLQKAVEQNDSYWPIGQNR